MNQPTQKAMQKLWDSCQAFVKEQKISCDDAIWQTDHIIIASPELVHKVCEIVGYQPWDD